jgi:FkbM family methyltransferase
MSVHLATPRVKFQTGLATVGLKETLIGLFRYAQIVAKRKPQLFTLSLKSGASLRFIHPTQTPTMLVVFGDYVDPEYEWIKDVIQPGDLVVDVGAGIGQFAVAAGMLGAGVICYEPVLANADVLAFNLNLNDLGSTIVNAVALSDETGYVSIEKPPSEFLRSHIGELLHGPKDGLTPCSTLDEEFKHGQRIKLLKINTAGSEPQVLRGGLKLLAEQRVEHLILLLSEELVAMLPTLRKMGYDFFYYHPKLRGTQALDPDRPFEMVWPARHVLGKLR